MRFVSAVATAAMVALASVPVGPLPAMAASPAEVDRLVGLLGVPRILAIMAQEGEGYGEELRVELLGDAPSPQWEALIDRLYEPEAMMAMFRPEFGELLAETEVAPLLGFFGSDLGQRIVGLELAAREAMIDPDIEAAAGERLAQMRDDGDPRLALLDEFVEANDLIENNVVGALNASLAFYNGLAGGAGFAETLTEDRILADVWDQEAGIRLDTVEWVYAYLAMAYRPLQDDELGAYIALSRTPEGQALNRALFDAFDVMYVGISEALGRGAAQLMAGQDL